MGFVCAVGLLASLSLVALGCGGVASEAALPPPPPPSGGGSLAQTELPGGSKEAPAKDVEEKKPDTEAAEHKRGDGLSVSDGPVSLAAQGHAGQGIGAGAGHLGGGGGKGKSAVNGTTAAASGDGLAPEVIQRTVRQGMGRVKECYEKAIAKNAMLAGKVAVKFTIDPKGAVLQASPAESEIADAEMVSCVVGVVRSLSFPTPDNGEAVVVTYPFNFSSAGN